MINLPGKGAGKFQGISFDRRGFVQSRQDASRIAANMMAAHQGPTIERSNLVLPGQLLLQSWPVESDIHPAQRGVVAGFTSAGAATLAALLVITGCAAKPSMVADPTRQYFDTITPATMETSKNGARPSQVGSLLRNARTSVSLLAEGADGTSWIDSLRHSLVGPGPMGDDLPIRRANKAPPPNTDRSLRELLRKLDALPPLVLAEARACLDALEHDVSKLPGGTSEQRRTKVQALHAVAMARLAMHWDTCSETDRAAFDRAWATRNEMLGETPPKERLAMHVEMMLHALSYATPLLEADDEEASAQMMEVAEAEARQAKPIYDELGANLLSSVVSVMEIAAE